MVENLGNPYSIISRIAVKKYPTCQLTHRAIDAVLCLADTYQISPDDVAEVECQTGSMASDVLVFDKPANYLQGKFSMQFCLAIALLARKVGMLEVTDEKVNDLQVRQLMERVRLRCQGEPLALSDIVKVRLKDGREYSLSVDKARGDCELPLTDEEIISKYKECAGTVLPGDKVKKTLELMLNLEQLQHISDLMDMV